VKLEDNKFMLNGKTVFQRTVLDQGFYPDGIYTAPDDETLERDIILSILTRSRVSSITLITIISNLSILILLRS